MKTLPINLAVVRYRLVNENSRIAACKHRKSAERHDCHQPARLAQLAPGHLKEDNGRRPRSLRKLLPCGSERMLDAHAEALRVIVLHVTALLRLNEFGHPTESNWRF